MRSTTPFETLPRDIDEMIALADFYLNRLNATQAIVDVYPAVLATVHVVDWYVEGELRRKLKPETRQWEERFPAWKTLKDFANGLKHAVRDEAQVASSARKLQATTALPEWGDDVWEHIGTGRLVWKIQHEGRLRSISALSWYFLRDFEKSIRQARSSPGP